MIRLIEEKYKNVARGCWDLHSTMIRLIVSYIYILYILLQNHLHFTMIRLIVKKAERIKEGTLYLHSTMIRLIATCSTVSLSVISRFTFHND